MTQLCFSMVSYRILSVIQEFLNMYGLRTGTQLLHSVIYQANECVTSQKLHLICVCIYILHWRTSSDHVSLFSCIDFFLAELCEVLKMFMANSEDVDLLDRAHIYHSLLVSLSNKKVCICTHLLLSFYFILAHVLAC